ncbi:MAG: V-type ATPase subunit [Victivallales bacterium]|nr:V-type ATPase subunit [Victivallales bacterium]
MAHSSINAGVDFLYALLHGWWASSAQGERLMTLTRSATEDNFFHQLQSMGIVTIGESRQVHVALILRQYGRLCKLAEAAGPAVAQYVQALLCTLESENFKALMNYRFFPEREGHLVDFLIPFPGECTREADLVELLDIPTLDEFMKRLRPEFQTPEYCAIARQLEEDRDIMRAECALDNLNIRAEIQAIAHLPLSMRAVARSLLAAEIDTTNVCTLLRNANFYHMDAKRLAVAWIDGGAGRVSRALWDRLADAPDASAVIEALPSEFAEPLRTTAFDTTSRMENILRCRQMRHARKAFYDSGSPTHAIPAYPFLLRMETINLGRIYEGIRFSVSAREIEEMMIQ